jgi:proteasome component ECM29
MSAQIALREARRNNHTYQLHSLAALGDVAMYRTDVDISDEVFETIDPLIKDLVSGLDDDAMEIDEDATTPKT